MVTTTSTAFILFVIIVAVSLINFIVTAQQQPSSSSSNVNFITCDDLECRTGCRTVGVMPNDQCTFPPFKSGSSMLAVCSQAPSAGLCYYFGTFAKNDTTGGDNYCTDANAESLSYHQCDVCRPSQHKQGSFEKTTCGLSSNSMKLKLDCDAGCTNCQQTHAIQPKSCFVPPGGNFPNAIEVSAPSLCAQIINAYHYSNTNCSGTAQSNETVFSGVCYSQGGRSHLYQCA